MQKAGGAWGRDNATTTNSVVNAPLFTHSISTINPVLNHSNST